MVRRWARRRSLAAERVPFEGCELFSQKIGLFNLKRLGRISFGPFVRRYPRDADHIRGAQADQGAVLWANYTTAGRRLCHSVKLWNRCAASITA